MELTPYGTDWERRTRAFVHVIFWFIMNRREENVYRRRGALDERKKPVKAILYDEFHRGRTGGQRHVFSMSIHIESMSDTAYLIEKCPYITDASSLSTFAWSSRFCSKRVAACFARSAVASSKACKFPTLSHRALHSDLKEESAEISIREACSSDFNSLTEVSNKDRSFSSIEIHSSFPETSISFSFRAFISSFNKAFSTLKALSSSTKAISMESCEIESEVNTLPSNLSFEFISFFSLSSSFSRNSTHFLDIVKLLSRNFSKVTLLSCSPKDHSLLSKYFRHPIVVVHSCMVDPEHDHDFVFDDQGLINIHRSPFFNIDPEVDYSVEEFVERILFSLATAIDQ
ncbi:hypothetical protein M5K25_005402 [Dendrobium thyrsiflorum]|uniref:Uncharacterized protein n=1 Tax=Dendrobium thyrsiflorum TaxID=117978 RepID=A0ABD0VHE0_DENTH